MIAVAINAIYLAVKLRPSVGRLDIDSAPSNELVTVNSKRMRCSCFAQCANEN